MAKTTGKPLSPKKPLSKRVKRTAAKKKLDSSLNTVYGEAPRRKRAASQLRMARRQKKSRASLIIITLLTITFFAALSWVGLYYFAGGNTFNDKNIRISIDTPNNITSGDEISFTIHYRNNQKTALENSELRVKPPTGFVLSEAQPKANGTNEFHYKLGTLRKNDGGKIIMNGTFIGVKDGNHEMTAFFTYRPENFNADFEKVENASLKISESPLKLSINGPDEVAAGAATTLNIEITNDSPNTIAALKLDITPPDQFDISKTDPKQKNDTEFIITDLEAKDTWKGQIEGSFKNSATGELTFAFETKIIIDNKEFLQNELKHFIEVTTAQLETILTVNDFEKKGSVAPGSSFTTNIDVKNNGDQPMEQIELILEIEAPAAEEKSIINWDTISKNKNIKIQIDSIANNRQRATIVWNQENSEGLSSLAPNSSEQKSVTIPVMTPQDFGEILPGNTIIVSAKTSASGGAQSQTAPFEITLRSDTNISASLTPVSDPVIGIGPDGLTEVSVRQYDLNVIISNSLHEIIDIEVIAALAPGVIFERAIDIPAGELQYVPSKKAMRWTLNKLPLSVPQLSFTTRVDSITTIGEVETDVILNGIQLTAIDGISDEPFIIKLGQILKQ